MLTEYQESGRGQRNSRWESASGKNLTFTVILYPRFVHPTKQFQLNQLASLAVRDTVSHFTDQHTLVKWPNDVMLQRRKVCGILIQSALQGMAIQYTLLGIGLNVNQANFPADLSTAISMQLAAQRHFDREQVLYHLCQRLEFYYLMLRRRQDTLLHQSYLDHLYLFQQPAVYQRPGGNTFVGRISGLSPEGKLIIQHGEGSEEFDQKTVSLVHPL